MKVLDWVCKLLAFPFFIAELAVIMPWLEFIFWIDDDRDMKWKLLHMSSNTSWTSSKARGITGTTISP